MNVLHRHLAFGLLIALGVPGGAALASAQTTTLAIQSEAGDYIGQGLWQTYTPPVAAFAVSRNFLNGINVSVTGAGFSWTLNLSAPGSLPIAAGYYPAARRYPFTSFNGLSVSADSRGCNVLTGRYLVREVQYGPAGSVERLAIDVEQHCEDVAPALFVALRYNSTVPTDIFPGTTAQYSLTASPAPNGLVSGAGLTCGVGATACAVTFGVPSVETITASPNSGWIFTGWTDDCSGGPATAVHVNSAKQCGATFEPAVPTAPRTLLTMNSPPGEYIGRGRAGIYSSANSLWRVDATDGGNGVRVEVRSVDPVSESHWTFLFRAPAGESLRTGPYPDTQRAAFRTTTPGLDIFGNGRGCNVVLGEFLVKQIEFHPSTGGVTALALDYTQHCETWTAPALTGTLQYRATYEIASTCATPDPFVAIGGGTCFNGGWLPPGMPVPETGGTPPPSTPPPAGPPAGCTTQDPFVVLGGGTCHNGGWLPPGIPVPSAGSPSPPPTTPPPEPPPGVCTTPDPFAALGGGICFNGGWLPPGMPVPGGGSPSPPPPSAPPPAPPPGVCTTPDPFVVLGGGTCHNGGWLPPGMLPSGSGSPQP